MSSVEIILAKLEELSANVGYLQADVSALRKATDSNRQEYRVEIANLRADLARFVNRVTTAVEDAKKKPTKTPGQSKISSEKLPELTRL